MDRAFPKRARWLAGTTWDWTKAKRGRRKTKSWRTEKARTNKTRRDEPRWTTRWKYFHHARFVEKIGLSFGFQMLCQSYSDVDDYTCHPHTPACHPRAFWLTQFENHSKKILNQHQNRRRNRKKFHQENRWKVRQRVHAQVQRQNWKSQVLEAVQDQE